MLSFEGGRLKDDLAHISADGVLENSAPTTTAAPPDAEICKSNAECDDGSHCNGPERCSPEDDAAGPFGCVTGENPCSDGRCSDKLEQCLVACDISTDVDGDGATDDACGGDDCDDGDSGRFPGNHEVCDAEDVDEDCDEKTFGERDADDDGYVDMQCCNGSGTTRFCGDDCDDTVEGIHPSESELCDGVDNDCDGAVDEGFECKWGDAPLACMDDQGRSGGGKLVPLLVSARVVTRATPAMVWTTTRMGRWTKLFLARKVPLMFLVRQCVALQEWVFAVSRVKVW